MQGEAAADQMYAEGGPMCAQVALNRVHPGSPVGAWVSANIAVRRNAERIGYWDTPDWNDAPCNTADNVIATFRRLAAAMSR